MTTNTMVALKSVNGTGSSGTLSFTSIPATYTDLMLVVNVGLASGSTAININLNGDTNSHYSMTRMYGNGSSAGSDRLSNTNTSLYSWNAYNGGTYIFNFQNYANTTTYKTILGRASDVNNAAGAYAVTWRGSTGSSFDAINQIDFVGSNNFATTTTATLYGIANADIGAYATGGIITQDANYYYHAFGNSSYFVPTRNLTADILVVAGGGGAGGASGGGAGGAGGLLTFASQALTSGTSYTCTVGAGGPAGASSAGGSSGGNSSFGSISGTVYGGGGGGWRNTINGSSGGSGGGAGSRDTSTGSAGAGTSGQGNSGGASVTGYRTGGGGGAVSAGSAATSSQAGAGGNGYYSTFTDAIGAATGLGQLSSGHYYFAGGGGAGGVGSGSGSGTANYGIGGLGGGGTGATAAGLTGSAGMANTGGGGGSGWVDTTDTAGGSGGSGLIIVRYAK